MVTFFKAAGYPACCTNCKLCPDIDYDDYPEPTKPCAKNKEVLSNTKRYKSYTASGGPCDGKRMMALNGQRYNLGRGFYTVMNGVLEWQPEENHLT